MKSFKISIIMAAVVVFGIAGAARAQKIWVGGAANNNWTSAANWQDGVGANVTLADYVFDAANLTGSRTIGVVTIADANIGNISFTGNSTVDVFQWNTGTQNTVTAPAILQGNVTVNSGNHTGTVFLKIDDTSTWDIAANSSFSKGGADTLAGTGTLIKSGAGILTLNNNFSTWAGTMRLDAGVLRVTDTNSGAFGNSTATLRLNGGELRLVQNNGRTYTVGSVVVGGNASVVHTRGTSGVGHIQTFGPLSIGAHTLSFSQSDAGGHLPTSASGLVFGATTLTGNATFDVLNSGSVVNSMSLGAIGDGGSAFSLTKTGAGTLTLTADSTYSGGTTVSGGTLDISTNANALGTGTLTLGNGTTVNANNSSRVYYNNNLVIGGDVSLTGSRTTYNGTVDLGNATRTLTVTNAVNNGNLALQLQGVISGDGGIIKEGTGGLRLGNMNNTFTGDVSVNAGMLEIREGGSLGNAANKLIINGDGTVYITNQGISALTISNNVEVNANFDLGGGGTNTMAFNGTMNLGGGNRTINLNGTNNKAINGVISNGGLTIAANDGANLFLGGDNTYTGATQVNSGGLIVGGSLAADSAVSVAAGARLGGDGTIAGSLTLDSGAFLVFDPSLSLTVSGTVALDNSFGVASLVKADGTAIDWTSVSDGTYTLLGDTASTFNTITNFGLDQAKDIGDGRKAYFENGSLQLVVIPEPATLGLFMSVGGLVLVLRRWLWDRR